MSIDVAAFQGHLSQRDCVCFQTISVLFFPNTDPVLALAETFAVFAGAFLVHFPLNDHHVSLEKSSFFNRKSSFFIGNHLFNSKQWLTGQMRPVGGLFFGYVGDNVRFSIDFPVISQ